MQRATTRRAVSRALACLAATAVVVAMIAPAAHAAGSPAASPLPGSTTIEGVLRVVPMERTADPDKPLTPAGIIVTLITAQGTAVALAGAPVASAVSGDSFSGTVAVGKSVRDAVAKRLDGAKPPAEADDLAELIAESSAAVGEALTVTTGEVTPVVAPAVAAKAHTVDVMYIGESGGATPSTAAIDAVVARLGDFWVSQSNGQIASITRPQAVKYAVQPAAQLCNQQALWNFAAGASGFNRPTPFPSQPDYYYWGATNSVHLLVLVPAGVCGEGNGLGTIGSMHSGGTTWSSVDPGDPADWDGVVFHEVGHNLGLAHSNATICSTPPTVDGPAPACQQAEYRDFYDVMGGGFTWGAYSNAHDIAALNVTQKVRLDALPRGSALKEVRVAGGADQDFTLAPASAVSGTRGLEILDPLNNDLLYVEYRSGTGRDAASFYSRISADPGMDQTTYAPGVRVLKVGCTPTTSCTGSFASTVLGRWVSSTASALSYRAGDDFVSRSSSGGLPGVRVSVQSTSASGAVVHVSFDSSLAVFAKPTVTVTGTPSYYRTLTATTSPAWSPAPTSTAYQWLRDGESIPGATAATYRVQSADMGRALSVRATAKRTGYATASATSAKVTVASNWSPVSVSGTIGLPSGVAAAAWNGMVVRAVAVDALPDGASSQVQAAVNAANGAYALTGMAPGRWRIVAVPAGAGADAPPFDVAAQWYGATPDAESATIVDLDADRTGVSFTLPRSLHVTGTVSLPAGSTAAWRGHLVVWADPEWGQPAGQSPRGSSAKVDAATGRYDIAGLDPGAYALRVAVDDESAGTIPLVPTYYPGVVAYADRTPITLAGANRAGADVTMQRERTISGRVTLPAGKPSSWFGRLQVQAVGALGASASVSVAADGNYAIAGLTPDRYTVCTVVSDWDDVTDLVTTCSDGTYVPVRAATIDVRTADRANVAIAAKSGRTISGTVRPPAGTPLSHIAGTTVTAVPLTARGDVDWSGASVSTRVDETTGVYTLRRVIPGTVAVRFDPPSYWYDPATDTFADTGLVSLWYGGTLTAPGSTPLDVGAANAAGVDITLTAPSAAIRGTLAVPAIAGAQAQVSLRVVDGTGTEDAGAAAVDGTTFAATGLVPGTYRLLLTVVYQFADGSVKTRTQYLRAPDGSKAFAVPAAGLSGVQLTAAAAESRVLGSLSAAGFDDSTWETLANAFLYERDGSTWVRYPDPLATASRNETVHFTSDYLATGTYTIGYLATPAAEQHSATGVVQEWWKGRASLAAADEIALSGSLQTSGFHGAVHAVGVEPPVIVDPPLTADTPIVSGTPRVGAALTAKPGVWTTGTTFAYEWLVAGEVVDGATAATFVPRTDDIGKTVAVRVTGSKEEYTSVTKLSASTSAVTAAPVASSTPTISGTPRIGVRLTAKPGTWTTGTTLAYQWLVGGVAVSGAKSSTFVPRAADQGKTVSVRVTGSKPLYLSVTKTSAATAKVLPLLKLTSATPKISGTAKVGSKLTAKPGKWTTGTMFAYQWMVNGKSVSGATKSTFVPRASDKGKKVTVRVTGKKAGYTTVKKTSKATSAVKKK